MGKKAHKCGGRDTNAFDMDVMDSVDDKKDEEKDTSPDGRAGSPEHESDTDDGSFRTIEEHHGLDPPRAHGMGSHLRHLFEVKETFEDWAVRISLSEETRQELREQQHHAMHRHENHSMSHKKLDKYKAEHGEWYYSASLGLLKLNHWPRRWLLRTLNSQAFRTAALVCIVISAACLGLEDPTDPTGDPAKDVMWKDVWISWSLFGPVSGLSLNANYLAQDDNRREAWLYISLSPEF